MLFQKLDKQTILPMADKIMEQLLRVLQAKNATCHEETFAAIAAVTDLLESDFAVSYDQLSFVKLSTKRNSHPAFYAIARNICLHCSLS